MFGEMRAPKMRQRSRPRPTPVDISHPCPHPPGNWAHMGREADTDQPIRMMLYKQRKEADNARKTGGSGASIRADIASTKFDKHAAKSRFQGEIKKRASIRIQEYEASIEKRRVKLADLLAEEEREFYKETVDNAQRGGESRMVEMKQRAEMLIANREAERLEVVKDKRLQQYMKRCVDLRETLAKKNLIESKHGQLQQMRENEARREMDREREKMWHDITMKDLRAKAEREVNEAIDRHQRDKGAKEVWDLQVEAKQLGKAEAERIAQEDRVELEKLREQLRQEEIEALDKKRRMRDEAERRLKEELGIKEQFLAQRRKEEQALEQAFTMLAQMELDKERAMIQDTTTATRREMAQYRASLVELEKQRAIDEMELNELLDDHKREIQRKQDEAKCKIEAARRKLHQDVMKGRAEQVQHKQELAQEELNMKKADNELLRLAYDTNTRLEEETKKQEIIARLQYRDDLLKQIEYNQKLQERERQELERQLAIGREEEERYVKMVADMCAGNIKAGDKHPFRKVLERYDCNC